MAIKPNDCVVKLKDLIIGHEPVTDFLGVTDSKAVFATYWENFLTHVENTTNWQSRDWNAYDKNLALQLAKFNAVYKQTKNWEDHYLKFNSHKDLTLFVLRWS
jgi:hypothetical protein